jgi:hypothetical protein
MKEGMRRIIWAIYVELREYSEIYEILGTGYIEEITTRRKIWYKACGQR